VSRRPHDPAPLAATYREQVLWQAQADPPTIEPHALPGEVDVAVVGAGYCGLAAARELARAGRSVVVVERDPIGVGASTRNGGMVIPELKAGPAGLEEKYGAVGRRLYGQVNDAFDHVEALIADEQIDCDYHRAGQLYLAQNQLEKAEPHLLASAKTPDASAAWWGTETARDVPEWEGRAGLQPEREAELLAAWEARA